MTTRVVLIGLMGVGKTTTGRLLADRLGWRLWDGDAALEARTSGTGAAVALRDGVEALHRLEAELLLEALAPRTEHDGPADDPPAVLCPAASVVDDPRCRAALGAATLVTWLRAPAAVLLGRRTAGDHRRHATADEAATDPAVRELRFAEVADVSLDATRPTEDLVDAIVTELGRRGVTPVTR